MECHHLFVADDLSGDLARDLTIRKAVLLICPRPCVS